MAQTYLEYDLADGLSPANPFGGCRGASAGGQAVFPVGEVDETASMAAPVPPRPLPLLPKGTLLHVCKNRVRDCGRPVLMDNNVAAVGVWTGRFPVCTGGFPLPRPSKSPRAPPGPPPSHCLAGASKGGRSPPCWHPQSRSRRRSPSRRSGARTLFCDQRNLRGLRLARHHGIAAPGIRNPRRT